jgi:ATP-dependent DNA helicase RecG
MTKDDLLKRLDDIEWDDFEVKEAHSEIPENIWETVSAFANTSGGWIVLGVQEIKKNGKVTFSVTGVGNAGKLEQDFIVTLRSQTKFNLLMQNLRRMLVMVLTKCLNGRN